MIGFAYLYKGLCGLANAYRASPLAGHLGAAVLAGYFFAEDHGDLDESVYAAVEGELDRIIRGEETVWFNPKKAGITIPELFQPLPEERPDKELVASIPQALAGNIDRLRQSGHNVIFASIAVRAFHDHPEYATPSLVGGVRKLIKSFNSQGPGRGYYGAERGWVEGRNVTLPADPGPPPYENEAAMAEAVIDELIRSAPVRRQGFGGLWHVINHAAGLAELSVHGHKDLARKGFAAHRHHLRLFRSLPDVERELGGVKRASHDPRTPEFWSSGPLKRDEARLTHRIKTLYGFFALAKLVQNPAKRKQAEASLRYLMA